MNPKGRTFLLTGDVRPSFFTRTTMTSLDKSSLHTKCEEKNKSTLLAALRETGAATATVTYQGSGDSGYVEGVSIQDANDAAINWSSTVTYCDVENRFENGAWHPVIVEKEQPLETALSDFAMTAVYCRHGGWENNEGGCGNVVFDTATDVVRIEHTEYFIDSACEETLL
jgi:hypothetical protein